MSREDGRAFASGFSTFNQVVMCLQVHRQRDTDTATPVCTGVVASPLAEGMSMSLRKGSRQPY